MSDETLKHGPASEETGFERQDMSSSGVYVFFAALAIGGVLTYFIVIGLYGFLERYDRSHQPAQNPLTTPKVETRTVVKEDIETFAQPRLEVDERRQLNDIRLQEESTLHRYQWADEKAGVVRIPIERAMDLIVQRGLPTRPANSPTAANPGAASTKTSKPATQAKGTKGKP